jgi:hypothetical protein
MVSQAVAVAICISSVLAFIFTYFAAHQYRLFGKDVSKAVVDGMSAFQSTEKLSTSLYVAASLQVTLLVALGIRGLFEGTKLFQWGSVQSTLVAHNLMALVLVTSTWGAQIVRDSMNPNVGSQYAFDITSSAINHNLAHAYVYHTVSFVFSVIYASLVFDVLFLNLTLVKKEAVEQPPPFTCCS